MQLTINQPSLTFFASLLKPFLLVGVAAISSAALYSPLSSQSQSLKNKINNDALKHISPYTEKGIQGSKKLFEKLGSWAKSGANSTDKVKEWIKSVAGGTVSNGAREIYVTLEKWAQKIYDFLKQFFTKEAWENFKKNVQKLGQLLNLFKNLMKLQIGGKASIFDKLGNSELMEAMGGLAEKNPELLGQLDEQAVEDIADALQGDPESAKKVMQEMAKRENVTADDLKNALRPSTLIGKIEKTIERAKEIEKKEGNLSSEDQEEGKKVLATLKELYSEVNQILEKAKTKKK